MSPRTTPSQTVGPYFSIGLPWPEGPEVVPDGTEGAIWLRGRVLDGEREPIPDALIETWQCDPEGRYETPGFRGFGRCPTDADGAWAIRTVKPGAVGDQAPHIAVALFARGLLKHVFTRIYFADEEQANASDPVLSGLDEPARATLVAPREGVDGYRFDVRLQGSDETVFFSV
jgi:protocatechuate 3,4-dioxygenase, alpha subunit